MRKIRIIDLLVCLSLAVLLSACNAEAPSAQEGSDQEQQVQIGLSSEARAALEAASKEETALPDLNEESESDQNEREEGEVKSGCCSSRKTCAERTKKAFIMIKDITGRFLYFPIHFCSSNWPKPAQNKQ
jgi:hypothetical protein